MQPGSTSGIHSLLRPLLDQLAHDPIVAPGRWQAWELARPSGGMNNLVVRATSAVGDFAVKFTIRDDRDRAGREFRALALLHEQGAEIAPRPVLLEQDSYAHPVVVQTWLAGERLVSPPTDDGDWAELLRHLAAIHAVTPASTRLQIDNAVLTANSPTMCHEIVHQQLALLPPDTRPCALAGLVQRLEHVLRRSWPPPRVVLCRVDPNTSNILRRSGPWASVDWENSGWGDGAFEVADMMAHPAYIGVSASRWEWVVDRYSAMMADPTAAARIEAYHKTMLVWWVARFARTLHDVPKGKDRRLVEPLPGWEEETRLKYDHYLALADALVR